MATLKDRLLNDENRPNLVRDCATLIDQEVARKKGVGGLAIKGAYKTVKAIAPGFVPGVIDVLLDDWVAKLEDLYGQFEGSGGSSFAGWVAGRADAVADRLLEVTDERAAKTSHGTAKKLYNKLRPKAQAHVSGAVPGLGAIVDRYLAKG